MTRIDSRPFLALGLALAIMAYVGCTKTYETTAPGGSKKVATTDGAGADTSTSSFKRFADWKGLEAALVISGEMDAYLEPCGCTDGQLGGLGRRYDLLEAMTAQGIPTTKIDLGSLTKNPASARGGIEQAKVKFETAIKALEAMKYDAMALSPEDLKFGIIETLTVYLNNKDALKIVAANASADGALKGVFPDTILDSVIAKAGPYKVGITAVIDPETVAGLKDTDLDSLKVVAPESILAGVLAKLESTSDLQVLMVQGPPELAKKLGEAFPGFDVVVSTSIYADPTDKPEMINHGATQLVTVGQKGKYVGVIGLFKPTTGKAPATRYQRVSLIGRNKNAEPMRVLIDEEMQAQFKALGLVEKFVRRPNGRAPGATYVGAEGCKSCHPNTFARWASTDHAKAYEVLINNPKDSRRRREYDAECISCHTTGFTYNSGWVSAEATPYLKGNQCENCHGPASKHIADPDSKDARKSLARTAEQANQGGLCHDCHDDDNSPKFDFTSYYGKIIHKGMDKYDDPRSHKKGMTPEQARAAK